MFKRERRKWRTTQKLERKNTKEMVYNNSSRRFRLWGSRVIALSIQCDSLTLRTESREEWTFSSGRTRKNFVPHGISSLSELCLFCWQLVSIFEENQEENSKKNRPVRRREASAHLNNNRVQYHWAVGSYFPGRGYSHTLPIRVCAAQRHESSSFVSSHLKFISRTDCF